MTDIVYELYWEPGFEESLRRMGMKVETFDRLGKYAVDYLLQTNPYEEKSTFELEFTESRYLHTRFRFPDLPAMVIAYVVDDEARSVTIQGAEPVWQDDLDPYSQDPYSDFDPDSFEEEEW